MNIDWVYGSLLLLESILLLLDDTLRNFPEVAIVVLAISAPWNDDDDDDDDNDDKKEETGDEDIAKTAANKQYMMRIKQINFK